MSGRKRKARRRPQKRFSVYVIELDPEVLTNRRFREANPDHDPGKACLYVGMTAREPEERFEQHRNGAKACRFARRYGLRLRPRLYRQFNPMTWEQACAREVELARDLRRRGFAVWQN